MPSVGSVSLHPLVSCTVCPLYVSNTHCTISCFCVTASTGVLYSLPTVCQYLILHRPLVLYHCVQWFDVESVHCLPVPHNAPSVDSLSLRPLLSSTVCSVSVSTSQSTVCFFCVTVSTGVLYSLSTVCQYLTLYHLLVLCHWVQGCLV